MKYIDIHAHLNFSVYHDDLDAIIERAKDASVSVINVGTQKDTSKRAVELAEQYEHLYAIVGLHPIHTEACDIDADELEKNNQETSMSGEKFDYEYYKTLAVHKKVVGIGECGLDYFRLEDGTIDVQAEAFDMQLSLASEIKKPVMLHTRPCKGVGRRVYTDVLDRIKAYPDVVGNLHFFAGTWDEAKQFIERGYTISATGVITFTHDYDEVIRNAPLESIMSETDCPYVTPVPYRGKRNEPAYVVEVVKKIAEIKKMPVPEVAHQLYENAKRVFGV